MRKLGDGIEINGGTLRVDSNGKLYTSDNIQSTDSQIELRTTYNGTEYWGIKASVDYGEGNTSLRAPIFYDNSNTAYYTHPADTTHSAKFRQHVSIGDGSSLTNDGSWGARLKIEDQVHSKIDVNQNQDSMKSHWYAHQGHDSIKFGTSTSHDVEIQRGGTTRIEATAGGAVITGTGTATSDFRAPAFYDSSNTDFYVDPVSGAKIYGTLYLGHTNTQPGTLVIYDTGNNGLEMKGTGANAFTFDMIGTGSTGSITLNDFNLTVTGNLTVNGSITGTVSLASGTRVNAGSSDYTGHTNVDESVFRMQTDYDGAGSQSLQFVNHNGNWIDGTSGADSAYGWMWGYQNNIRAGIHYDHRGSEKFDFYSSYGEIRFRTPASLNGNISPIGSESSMPARLKIAAGGMVTVTGNLTVNNNLYMGDGNDGYFLNDVAGRTAFTGGDFYFQSGVTNFYNYATNQYYGDSSGDNIHFRGNTLDGSSWTINPGDFRAPIYYDSNNTAYYLDAASTGTSLNAAGNVYVGGFAQVNNTKMGHTYDVSLNGINNNSWVTIAEFSGARKHDIIEVFENTSSRHNYLKLDVSWSYGQGSIQVLNGVRHSSHTIQKVRMLYNTSDRTYSTGKLQVYLGNWATSYTIYTKQSAFAKAGWGRSTLKTSVEEGTPSGYTEHEDTIMNVIEDPNGSFGSTGRITAGMGIDIYNGSPIKFHTASGDGTATERGFIDAQEGGHLRIATSGGENIVFQDGGVGGTTNLTILGSGEMVKEATERFTIKSHTNSWDGGLRFYASDNSTIFQMHPDTNGQMYVDREWRFNNSQINYGPIRRGGHNVGHLEGSYNNVGGNGSQSNPIYTIGSSYNPGTTSLNNMYGIGYTNQAASFISGGLTNGDWGFYVAADGDARVFIDGSTGHGNFLGNVRATSFYDINNTTYYIDPAESTSAYFGGNVSVPSNTGLVARGDWAKITTSHGYIQLGPANTSHAHIYTDRPNFYLNKSLYILGDTLLNENDIRSATFYDLNNTSYFMDLSSTGDSVVTRGTIHIGPDGHLGIGDITHPKIAYPGYGAAWSAQGSSTGAIIIDLPGTLSNYDMMYFEVDIYEYSAQNATKIIVGGHNWNSGGNSGTGNTMWHNVGVKIIGDMDKAVRFGYRNNGSVNKRCMIIGEGSSSWSYATVHVGKVSGATSFYTDAIDYTGDWNVVQTTDNSDFTANPSTNFNSTGEQTLKTNGRMAAYGYMGNGNVGGTGSASWHPNGIYSNGTNWLYGTINMNNNPITNNRYIEFGAGSSHSHEMSTYNANNIRFRTSSNGASGILLQDNAGNFRAQLYGDGTNYGFLDGNWASWDLRKITNGAMYLNGDTSYYLQPEGNTSANLQGDIIINQYGRGVIGLYSSTKYQHVWSMGSAYRLSADGSGVGNLYGLSYTHTNVGTGTNQSISGLSHQLQHRHNGTLTAAIGSGIWTSGNVTAYSDIAVKRNLEVIPDALNKVCQINGYTYERTDYVKDEEDPEAPDILRQAGVVAQEVEKVLPEVVSGPEGNKAVAYGNMVSILIEAVKELKAEVDDLKEQLKNK